MGKGSGKRDGGSSREIGGRRVKKVGSEVKEHRKTLIGDGNVACLLESFDSGLKKIGSQTSREILHRHVVDFVVLSDLVDELQDESNRRLLEHWDHVDQSAELCLDFGLSQQFSIVDSSFGAQPRSIVGYQLKRWTRSREFKRERSRERRQRDKLWRANNSL